MVLAAGFHANASVVISGTRVIYNAGERESTLKLSNKGKEPALTQVWVDNGEANAAPTTVKVPFTVTPPVTRIDPDKAQTLRIFYTGEPLAKDKESVFWLNVLEVPPKPVADAGQPDPNYLQFAIRSRIKLFFRPQGLKGTAEGAPGQLEWQLLKTGATWAIDVRNPTAYHVSFANLDAVAGGKHAVFDEGGMVAPGETQRFPLKGDIPAGVDAKVHYRAINDYGGISEGDAPLTQAGTIAK